MTLLLFWATPCIVGVGGVEWGGVIMQVLGLWYSSVRAGRLLLGCGE